MVQTHDNLSEVTRRDIIDTLNLSGVVYHGRLGETEFLGRLFKLADLPSYDGRFADAGGDIFQHRINNHDWDDDWVWSDSRLNLLHGPAEVFLGFLAEMIHPAVRPHPEEAVRICGMVNPILRQEGWELAEGKQIAGRPVFTPRRAGSPQLPALNAAKGMAERIDAAYVHRQVGRIEHALEKDPEHAIGAAKELVETLSKTILTDQGQPLPEDSDFPKLVKAALKQLKLVADDIPDHAKAADTIRRLLMNLATIADGLAQLRNAYGTGHGKLARSRGLGARHARLAVGAATTLAVFMQETAEEM
jgi:AbiJ N-terminal domain 3/Abortive infection C-terminus